MKSKELVFHIPTGNKKEEVDHQAIMDSIDWSEIHEQERILMKMGQVLI